MYKFLIFPQNSAQVTTIQLSLLIYIYFLIFINFIYFKLQIDNSMIEAAIVISYILYIRKILDAVTVKMRKGYSLLCIKEWIMSCDGNSITVVFFFSHGTMHMSIYLVLSHSSDILQYTNSNRNSIRIEVKYIKEI